MKTDLYNMKNEVVGQVELPDRIFAAKWNAALVKQVLDAQAANGHEPWAHAKDRSEVRGGGRKPWRQKGTGRARHGSTRSPLWVGGGKSHGPRNERDYSQKVNKKMKRLALFSTLSQKMKEGELKVFENLAVEAPKTKMLAEALRGLLAMKKTAKRFDALLVVSSAPAGGGSASGGNANLFRASSNLQKAKALDATSLNVYDVLNHKNLLVDQAAIAVIEKHYRL
jgi:large subunit ribosomal protein L4